MIRTGWFSSLVLCCLALFLAGCETPGAKGTAGPGYSCADDDIRVGDTLMISLHDIPEALQDRAFVVRGDGTVNLPLLGAMKAAGKKFDQFEREVQTSYVSNRIYRQVTVVVKPGDRFYSVGGEVKAPGRQIYAGQTTVLRAIVTCGDFTDFANRRKVEIVRASGEREIMDCNKARKDPKRLDRPLCPGDAIFVPRSL